MFNLTHTKKITFAAIATVLVLVPAAGYSLGIGNIKLQSKLNQPLKAEIELLTTADDDITDLHVTLASPEKFDAAGIPWSYFLKAIKFNPVKRADGSLVVELSSKESLKEFFLSFIVEVNWNRSKNLYREFTLLIDPSADYDAAVTNVEPNKTLANSDADAGGAMNYESPINHVRKKIVKKIPTEYGPTKRSDSIRKIARITRYEGVSTEQMMVALVNANPDAFSDDNIHSLMSDQVLRIPEKEVVLDFSRKEAFVAIKQQDNEWDQRLQAKMRDKQAVAVLNLKTVTNIVKDDSTPEPDPLSAKINKTVSAIAPAEPVTRKAQSKVQLKPQANPSNVKPVKPEQVPPEQVIAKDVKPSMTIVFPRFNKTSEETNAVAPVSQVETSVAPDSKALVITPEDAMLLAKQNKSAQKIPLTKTDTTLSSDLNELNSPFKTNANGVRTDVISKYSAIEKVPETNFLALILSGVCGFLLSALGFLVWQIKKKTEMLKIETESKYSDAELEIPSIDQPLPENSGFLFTHQSAANTFDEEDNNIDPTIEADVYITYGLYEKAESLITQALEEAPEDNKYQLKLLEIFLVSGNIAAFDAHIMQMSNLGKNKDPVFWSDVVKLKNKFKAGEDFTSGSLNRHSEEKTVERSKKSSETTNPSSSHNVKLNKSKLDKNNVESMPPSRFEPQNHETNPIEPQTQASNEIAFDLSGFEISDNNVNARQHSSPQKQIQTLAGNEIPFDLSGFDSEKVELSQSSEVIEASVGNEIPFDLSGFDNDETASAESSHIMDIHVGNEIPFDLSDFDNSEINSSFNPDSVTFEAIETAAADNEITFDLSGFDSEEVASSHASDTLEVSASHEMTFNNSASIDDDWSSLKATETHFDLSAFDETTQSLHSEATAFDLSEVADFDDGENQIALHEQEMTFDISAFDDSEAEESFDSLQETDFDVYAFDENEAASSLSVDKNQQTETTFNDEVFDDYQTEVSIPVYMESDEAQTDQDTAETISFTAEAIETITFDSDEVQIDENMESFDLSDEDVEEEKSFSAEQVTNITTESAKISLTISANSDIDLSDFDEDEFTNINEQTVEQPDLELFELDNQDLDQDKDQSNAAFDLSDFNVEDASVDFSWANRAASAVKQEQLAFAAHQQNNDDSLYDPNAALEFFVLFGKAETAKKGETIFAYKSKEGFLSALQTDKMYFLIEGRVTVQTKTGETEHLLPGAIFGEHTPYPSRSYSAIAAVPCVLKSLSEKQLLTGFKDKPEFILMLMGIFIQNIRKAETQAKAPASEGDNQEQKEDLPIAKKPKSSVLSAKMLQELVKKLGDNAVMNVPQQRIIFKAGGSAMLMYIILEGYMSIQVGQQVVGQSGPGDIVGEIALVDQKPRTATVVAETRCSLLAITRETLFELIETVPNFSISLLRVLASRLSFRIDPTDDLDDWDW